jgi:hypothetical protein
VTIPADCASIGDWAFSGCTSLANLTIPADCALGENVVYNCPKVKVTIPVGCRLGTDVEGSGHSYGGFRMGKWPILWI